MFVIQLHYKVDLAEVEKLLNAHRDFLEIYYNKGIFLASGPKVPRTGGIIIATTNDKKALEEIIKQDPFYQADIATFEITQFTPVKHRPEIEALIRGQ